jgi:hypothetical protein
LVEQSTNNRSVTGSIPVLSTQPKVQNLGTSLRMKRRKPHIMEKSIGKGAIPRWFESIIQTLESWRWAISPQILD